MFKKKLPQLSMLPAEVEVTHFYGRAPTFKTPTFRIGRRHFTWGANILM